MNIRDRWVAVGWVLRMLCVALGLLLLYTIARLAT